MSLLGIIYCYECTGVVVVVMAVFAYGGCGAEDVVVLDVAEGAETGLAGVPDEDVPLRILSSPKVTVVTARRWPTNVIWHCAVSRSHILTVRS